MTSLAIAYGRQSVAASRDARDGGSVSIAFQRQASELVPDPETRWIVEWMYARDGQGRCDRSAGR